jgi:ATP-binding cassette subfamily B protein
MANTPTAQPNTALPLLALLGRLWLHISPRRQRQFSLLFILMILASIAEIVSIGAVLPFLAVLTEPQRIFTLPALQGLISALGITQSSQLLLPLTIGFGISAVGAGAMRLLLLWASTRLSFATGADLSSAIYERTLYQDYAVHTARNSSVIIDGILNKTNNVIFDIVMPTLMVISAVVMLILILSALIWVDPGTALLAFSGFGLIYALVLVLTKKRLRVNSERISKESAQVIKTLQEGLGGIRDVLIDGTQETYCQSYRKADAILRHSQGDNTFIATAPRFVVEALGMLLIAALAYWMSSGSEGIAQTVPILGALALGAQRLVPILQQAYGSWARIKGSQSALAGALDLLDQPMPLASDAGMHIPFEKAIELVHIDFAYPNTGASSTDTLPGSSDASTSGVFRDLNLTIPKGTRLGIVGTTGCGKSTLLDLVMGLLEPTNGELLVDGQPITKGNRAAWQKRIAHVPQAIYLSDNSIAQNIAFGVRPEEIDFARVKTVAAQAQILDIIESWPDQFDTIVGERGVRLSGGQRQRIGIARALYKKADVIIFDEATSALDNETEETLIQTIEALRSDITIVMIAHRLTTLRNCTQIIELGGGSIVRTLSYSDLIRSNA